MVITRPRSDFVAASSRSSASRAALRASAARACCCALGGILLRHLRLALRGLRLLLGRERALAAACSAAQFGKLRAARGRIRLRRPRREPIALAFRGRLATPFRLGLAKACGLERNCYALAGEVAQMADLCGIAIGADRGIRPSDTPQPRR